MQRQPTTPEQIAIENDFVASLSPDDRDAYRVHLHARGRMAWQAVLEPETPAYEGIAEDGFEKAQPVDLSQYDLNTAHGLLEAAQAHGMVAREALATFMRHVKPMNEARRERLRESAEALGLSHVLD